MIEVTRIASCTNVVHCCVSRLHLNPAIVNLIVIVISVHLFILLPCFVQEAMVPLRLVSLAGATSRPPHPSGALAPQHR